MFDHFSREVGRLNHKRTLHIDEYIRRRDAGTLSDELASLGFRVYSSAVRPGPTHSQEEDFIRFYRQLGPKFDTAEIQELVIGLSNLSEEIGIAKWASTRSGYTSRQYFTGGLGGQSTNDLLTLFRRQHRRATTADIMAGAPPQQPMVAINGVRRESIVPIQLSPNTQAPSGREDARLNMLRTIRPPPLKYAWTMYHDKHSDGTNYEGRLTLLLENIINVKHFWAALNHFPMEHLRMKDTVHFFKRGVRPVWEDPRNVNGGSWTFRVPKDKSVTFFHETLMLCVGEQFADVIQPKDDLCGCSLSTRFNSNLITIWNRDASNQKSTDGIVQVVLDRISTELKPKDGSYYYKKHSEHQGFEEAIAKARAKQDLSPANAPLVEPKVDPAEVRQDEVEQDERDEAAKLEEASKIASKVQLADSSSGHAPAGVHNDDSS